MTRFLARRLLNYLVLLALASFLTFALTSVTFAPLDTLLQRNPRPPQSVIDAKAAELNLDKPLPQRYAHWVAGAVHGDFGTTIGPGTDLHHLRPANATVNSTRNNLDFDEGGEEVEDAPGNFYDNDSFEPRDEVKGDVARMILYMSVRYEGNDEYPDLEPNDEVENNKDPYIGRLSKLKEWNEADPPSDFEKNRNEVIFDKFQKNRNPFIDHPEWVGEIWS